LISTKPSELFAQRRAYPEDLNAYLRIDEDGRVTVFSGKIEMGQGVLTSQAQMAAEELGVPLAAITMVLGDTDRCPWDAGTWGSLTTRVFGPALRAAAAEARTVLTRLASGALGVPRDQLVVENGVISVAGDPSRKVTYGQLAKGKTISRLVDEKAILRSVKEFKVMGQSPLRLDGVEKVTGRAQYAGDLRLPGMVYARILRPPAHGATRTSLDLSKAKAVPGVIVVEDPEIVAVLHADPETAEKALSLVKAEWSLAPVPFDTETVADYFVGNVSDGEEKLARGDVAARREGERVFESTFRSPYKAHAPMEPHTALAEVKDGKLTVWASTQTPFGVRDQLMRTFGLDESQVRVVTPYLGGGFGGKSANPQAIEAARLARLTGKPVMVAWTRAEEFFLDIFDPAGVVKITSAIDAEGKITLWDYSVWASGDRAAELFYDAPNARIRTLMSRGSGGAKKLHLFATGAWRAPGAGTNVFARESQIDIMAAAAKMDPLAFRMKNIADERVRRTLGAAADAFGWKAAAGPSGQGRGIAIGYDSGTYAAIAASVKVDKATGAVKVDRVVCAQDMGIVVNPVGAKMQMEGCVTMGLGYVFAEELQFKGGAIADQNFGTYEIPRFSWVPRIETVLVQNDELAPQGGGEPAIVPMGAAIANAIFDATGARLYRLPMTPKRVLAALKR
ncbi:MAG TPA: molybdopterin cofactor-binding domain-containing protein, partial [Thermoanaerobaculia bacterium]|nr:molybdopterin cofactor-binding domain-containing protein [Thermoanaerobaculia bacterium]